MGIEKHLPKARNAIALIVLACTVSISKAETAVYSPNAQVSRMILADATFIWTGSEPDWCYGAPYEQACKPHRLYAGDVPVLKQRVADKLYAYMVGAAARKGR